MFDWLIPNAYAQAGGGGPLGSNPTLFMFVAIGAVWYFVYLRPQNQQEQERAKRLNAMTRGTRVVTSGGIHGTVWAVAEKTVEVEIADRLRITVNKENLADILAEPGDAAAGESE